MVFENRKIENLENQKIEIMIITANIEKFYEINIKIYFSSSLKSFMRSTRKFHCRDMELYIHEQYSNLEEESQSNVTHVTLIPVEIL